MKPTLPISILITYILFFSCQKKVDWLVDRITKEVINDTSIIQVPLGELLTKIVAVTGNETVETSFTYDDKHRLIAETLTGNENGLEINSYKRFVRDTSGKIIRIITKTRQSADTIFTDAVYDDFYVKTMLYSLTKKLLQGQLIQDSVTYTYDGNGRIGLEKTFRMQAGNYLLHDQKEYTYSGGNLIKLKKYADSGNIASLKVTDIIQFSYDTRTNPLKLNNEAILIGRPESVSSNNPLSLSIENNASINNIKIDSKLLYSQTRKPLYCTSTKMPAGIITQLNYFYR